MATPILPVLPGLGWNVHKKPTFSTRVEPHVSGRETRAGLYARALWEFELAYEGLDSAGYYPGLVAQSLQTLMGLYLSCQGRLNPFVYYDPTDYQVSGQTFGVGDGAATSFQLVRSIGGYLDPVPYPFAPSAASVFQVQGAAAAYAPSNLFNYSGAMTNAAWFRTNSTIVGGVSDPLGGTNAFTLTATAANGYTSQFKPEIVGLPSIAVSTYVKRRTGSGVFQIYNPAAGTWQITTVTGSWARQSILVGAVTWTGAGFLLATNGDAVDLFQPQAEARTAGSAAAPGAYFQSGASDYFGGPYITANSVFVDPSAYTITNGLVTFLSPPANGAVLAWTGYFGFLCRFIDDQADFENFMAGAWQVQSLKFRQVR